MKKAIIHSLLSVFLLATATAVTVAQHSGSLDVPRTISYQGLLTSVDGTPLPSGNYDITVTLFADEAGTQAVWQNTYRTNVINGIFNLYLGSENTPLPQPQQMNRPLWVGTSVNGAEHMTPLTPLTSSPYALNLPDKAVTTGKLADGAVTADKVEMPYVAGIRVNGEEISAKGAVLDLRSGKDIDVRYDDMTASVVIESKTAARQGDKEKGAAVQDLMPAVQNWIGRAGFGGIANPPVIQGGTSYNTLGAGSNTLIATAADYSSMLGGSANVIDTASDYDFIGGGGGNRIDDTSHYNAISGGQENYIGETANHNCIGCGDSNVILNGSRLNVIGGGQYNRVNATATYNVVGGGFTNSIATLSDYNVVAGGNINTMNQGDYNVISGGGNNTVGTAAGGPVDYTVIGGGANNIVAGPYSTIGGGLQNTIGTAPMAVIGGGAANTITAGEGTIAGGHVNAVYAYVGAITGGHDNTIGTAGEAGFIGGGRNNTVGAPLGAIGGGRNNNIMPASNHSFIGGGETNTVSAQHGTIGGGNGNSVTQSYSFVGGGQNNAVTAQHSIVGGGQNNMVTAQHSIVGGGTNNNVNAPLGTIGGGGNNTVMATAPEGTIAGGHVNRVEAYVGAITGGHDNTILPGGEAGFIGGGRNNFVDAAIGAIAGGRNNLIAPNSPHAAIGGGELNIVNASHGTIPGGDMLFTNASYAQSAMGFFNAPRGAVPFRPATIALTDDPLFMVGNGDIGAGARSNAFEVSYNGHSVVYDVNGSGGAGIAPFRAAIAGATYTDNVIYGWAEVDANGNVICNDFGIASIQHPAAGVYRVTLNITAPDGITPLTINCGAAVATLGTGTNPSSGLPTAPPVGTACAYIYTTNIVGNIFDVFITQVNPQTGDCDQGVDIPFKFHVTGRPN